MEKETLEQRMIKCDNQIKDFVKQIGAKSHKFDIHFSLLLGVVFPNIFKIDIVFEDGNTYGQSASSFIECFEKIVENVCWGQGKPNPYPTNKFLLDWKKYPDEKPTDYGEYLVHRKGCNKTHFETWNNTGWAYNNNDITHFTKIINPKV
jgi:hypothetical protein